MFEADSQRNVKTQEGPLRDYTILTGRIYKIGPKSRPKIALTLLPGSPWRQGRIHASQGMEASSLLPISEEKRSDVLERYKSAPAFGSLVGNARRDASHHGIQSIG